MKRLFDKVRDLPYWVMASATIALTSESALAAGSSDIAGAADTVTDQISAVGKLVVGGGFLGGLVMVAGGLMKLKQAADTQGQQVKYGDGLWRLGVGGGLVAIPAMTGMLSESLGLGSTGVTVTEAGGASF